MKRLAMVPPETDAVTRNSSTPEGSDVTCHTCQELEQWHWRDWDRNRADRFNGIHCTTCHSSEHRACIVCGACMPDGHRWDRFYCCTTCRVNGKRERERAELEHIAWEAENPAEALEQKRKREETLAQLDAMGEAMNGGKEGRAKMQTRRKRTAELRATAGRCAKCDKPFERGDTIYRRGIEGPILPYCEAHACDQPDGRHNKDAPEGRCFSNCGCPDDPHGRRRWLTSEPCAGCARLVANDRETADPRQFVREWQTAEEAEEKRRLYAKCKTDEELYELARELPGGVIVRTYCSENCRRLVVATEAKAKRQAARGELTRHCESCREEFTPRRRDARYCSPACRQRGHRERKAEIQA